MKNVELVESWKEKRKKKKKGWSEEREGKKVEKKEWILEFESLQFDEMFLLEIFLGKNNRWLFENNALEEKSIYLLRNDTNPNFLAIPLVLSSVQIKNYVRLVTAC